jgi:hypothetical protein
VVVVVLVVVVVVVVEVVLVVVVLVVVVGVTHTPAVQAPLQHCWFVVQAARFGLQLALLGSAAALRGVPTRSAPPAARSRNSVGVIVWGRGLILGDVVAVRVATVGMACPPCRDYRSIPGRT